MIKNKKNNKFKDINPKWLFLITGLTLIAGIYNFTYVATAIACFIMLYYVTATSRKITLDASLDHPFLMKADKWLLPRLFTKQEIIFGVILITFLLMSLHVFDLISHVMSGSEALKLKGEVPKDGSWLSVLQAPVFEELFYRGLIFLNAFLFIKFILKQSETKTFFYSAIATFFVGSIIFAYAHAWKSDILIFLCVIQGMINSFAFIITRNIWLPIIIHTTNNYLVYKPIRESITESALEIFLIFFVLVGIYSITILASKPIFESLQKKSKIFANFLGKKYPVLGSKNTI